MFPMFTSEFSRNPPVVTWLLVGVNGLVFFLELGIPKEGLEQIAYLFGVVPARLTHPEWAAAVGFPGAAWLTLLTSTFLHGSLIHILANMWTLIVFGRNVEDRMGPIRFLVFYLWCGVASGLIHTIAYPTSTVPAIGASGAIAGVMGAYLAMFPFSRVVVMIPIFFFPFFFDFLAAFYLIYWFLLQLLSGTFSLLRPEQATGIAFWAHVGGFVAGVLTFWLFLTRDYSRKVCFRDEGCYHHSWR